MRTIYFGLPLSAVTAGLCVSLWAGEAAANPPFVCGQSCQLTCPICNGCNGAVSTCSFECEQCFQECKEKCTYWDSTPLCNYLDRGIDDHKTLTEDKHVVFQSNINTLSDIDRMYFGLDLPATHCADSGHGVPCADKSYSVEWFIDSVRLSVAGVPLFFEEKGVNDGVLMIAKGGAARDGMVGWDRTELRANPMWGLSEAEVVRWFDRLPIPDAEGNIGNPQAGTATQLRHLTADEVGRLIEGIVGRKLAEANKSGNCAGKTYCDNSGDRQVYWRGAETIKGTQCDFGGCPPTTSRLPSPWLEIAGDVSVPKLEIDADVDVVKPWPDALDCPFGAPCGFGVDKGHYYTNLGSVSVKLEFGFECVPTDGGFTVRMNRILSDLGPDPSLGGALVARFGQGELDDRLGDATNFDFPFVYPECNSPSDLVTLEADGSLTFAAPPETPDSLWFPPARAIRYARWLAVPPLTQPRQALENAFGVPIANVSWKETLPANVPKVISGPIDPKQKRTFAEIQAALPIVVALGNACTGIDFEKVEIPPPAGVDAAEAVLCVAGVISPLNDARCEALGQLKAFALQSEIRQKCFDQNHIELTNDSVPGIYSAFVDRIEDIAMKLPPIETLLPVANLEIDVKTGKKAASDGFAFVDFADPAEITATTREKEACRNRFDETLVPDPYTYPGCADAEDPTLEGSIGCPCRDIVMPSADDGGFSDGAGSHLAHGKHAAGQYCDDSLATIEGNQVVCGRVNQQGKGYPVCMECGITTHVGCGCEVDADCEGIEAGLRCWGSHTDGAWPGDAGGGKCLPAPDGEDGREALEEMPWFCLDNCAALGQFQGWLTPACIYQGSGADLTHGACVDLDGGNSQCMPGECEEENLVCTPSGCSTECVTTDQCPGLGYPAHYVCDPGGHCVSPECAGVGVDFAYCGLYR